MNAKEAGVAKKKELEFGAQLSDQKPIGVSTDEKVQFRLLGYFYALGYKGNR